jgi:hypothetical protein
LLSKFYGVIWVAFEVDRGIFFDINQCEHFTINLENEGSVVKREAIRGALFE